MPSSGRFPIDREPAPFYWRMLRRSVIAIPLREAIKEELVVTGALMAEHRHRFKPHHNSAVFYRSDTLMTPGELHAIATKRLDEVIAELGEVREMRIDAPEEVTPPASLAHLDGRVIPAC